MINDPVQNKKIAVALPENLKKSLDGSNERLNKQRRLLNLLKDTSNIHDDIIDSDSSSTIYKCESRDSLPSLQGLALTSTNTSISTTVTKKYIDDDHSIYSSSSSSSSHHNDNYGITLNKSIVDLPWLRPKTSFSGYQISGYKRYKVTVTLHSVQMPSNNSMMITTNPHLCGTLTIKGLTQTNPQISTFFEGFAVTSNNNPCGFLSSSWPCDDPQLVPMTATDSIDMEHWLHFPSFKQKSLLDSQNESYNEQRYIYMRWKERFMLPDPFEDGIEGASFDGFYYIVHDQQLGIIQGFYYQEQAEKFQQLELAPTKDSSTVSNGSSSFEYA
ncbi:similar to Saccharomyces cerevisiae YBR105C VID24 Peripheral membrane protein located at Vid (vacuole import and degradation) vesicles [Maudiozyma saulgeensis]|uniref:Similar to Saccharomyces cerevisiae YBR105C VID24 Peripheral membrane protein located at Vid (Vacuole import and degradation) vesicles n=1 Tax=Maudiozyma saulgeensis TaxID=1789683 RepID=A0A1X7QX81_9SACH|nr:similar to Saccharomyces cerevisiae YBR105C VID24 Peripheral membrane protein located at Vid (vacuole import and degradation) vesicles [Kazachstania saulgeensis]